MQSVNLSVLKQPEFWGVTAEQFEIKETHLSWVFLAGDDAWKLKKPVALYFVDTSTLENRAFFCDEEIRLNRRTAPDYYLGVATLNGDPDAPTLNGSGELLDTLVHMRRWNSEQQLDGHPLLTDGAATLAVYLAHYQAQCAPAPSDSPFGDPTELAAPALLNFQQVQPVLSERQDLEQLEQLSGWADEALKRLWPRMSERKDQGRVREVHGDLHAGHIIVDDWGYHCVDCVEYRSEFRFVDVISEIANLVMDLEARGQQAFANRLINAWLETTGDYHGMWVYLPYKAYRAMVRAKSALLQLEPAKISAEASTAPLTLYRQYADRAESYTQVAHRFLIITQGTIGCGKGELSNRLVEDLGVIRLRTDVERRRMNGMAIDAPTDAELDAGIHGDAASDEVYRVLARHAEQLLRAGFPVMVSGSFLKAKQRERFQRLADAQGVLMVILKCEPPSAWVAQQIRERAVVAADTNRANLNVLAHQRAAMEPLSGDEETRTRVIDSSDKAAVAALSTSLKQALQPHYG
ncbi:AAA family ATPase [Litorivicinus lipolyticus]|uniref:bifunctional aminoglycoside phosphotransferase/ATP-binding protein n=1 Tax=Litorivicinus lipolyticus TaxID=418701 RepID=UPI003B5ABCAD